jgi:hypothetical protein
MSCFPFDIVMDLFFMLMPENLVPDHTPLSFQKHLVTKSELDASVILMAF